MSGVSFDVSKRFDTIDTPLESDHVLAASGKESANTLLDRSEFGVSTTLALKVIEKGSKSREALAATFAGLVGTVVQRGLMSRAADVLLKSSGSAELAVTDVALVAGAVVSMARVPGCVDGVAIVPFEQAFGDDAVGVTLTESTVDDAAGEVLGLGAGRGLKVVGDSAGSHEGSLAEWTRDRGALMDAAPHVLSQVIGTLEVAVAIGAVKVLVMAFFVLVVVASILRAEGKVASLAVVGIRPVVLGPHVVVGSSFGTETRVAGFALVRPLAVVQSCHVLDTSAPGDEAASAGVTLVVAHGGLEIEVVEASQLGGVDEGIVEL
jgi:hypothetical protein